MTKTEILIILWW